LFPSSDFFLPKFFFGLRIAQRLPNLRLQNGEISRARGLVLGMGQMPRRPAVASKRNNTLHTIRSAHPTLQLPFHLAITR
jgi:hypothetical protein